MLLEEHAPVKFHNIGYASTLEDVVGATGWLEQAFGVGSPAASAVLYLDDV
jgi:hypothetical protein